MPTDQDILRARVKTTGITETHFQIGELKYKLFDVGGQRSERRKWLGVFENVTALVFLIAISEYDQMLYEDETVNRMTEAMTLFESVANSRWFIKTSIILFLNKIDLFRAKLPHSPLANTFPEYKGGANYDAACAFLLDKFVALNQNPSKSIYAVRLQQLSADDSITPTRQTLARLRSSCPRFTTSLSRSTCASAVFSSFGRVRRLPLHARISIICCTLHPCLCKKACTFCLLVGAAQLRRPVQPTHAPTHNTLRRLRRER